MKKKFQFIVICGLWLLTLPATSRVLAAVQDNESAEPKLERSAEELKAAALKSLNDLAEAYSRKQRRAFMRLVSDDFQGDLVAFEDAVLKDFRNYRDVNLDFIPDNVTVEGTKAEVTFRYNMSVVDNAGTQTLYNGNSAYEFGLEEDHVKLVRMANPILFGNSLPQNENPISVPQAPAATDPGTAPGASGGSVVTGTSLMALGVNGFRFSSQSSISEGSADVIMFGGSGQGVEVNFGGGLESLGFGSLSSVTSVPSNPSNQFIDPAQVGQLIAVKTLDGKYAVIRITGVVANVSVSFEYKYQSNGSTSF